MLTRRDVVGGLTGLISGIPFASSCSAQPIANVFRPEDFGAKGDGVTNDSAAFAALAQKVNQAGGGTIALRRATYIVGAQTRGLGKGPAFQAVPLLEFVGCARPLVIRGNGATIRSSPGLRYGSFEQQSGIPSRKPLPNYDRGEIASPYAWMIMAKDCLGLVEISDLELDGNLRALQLGGTWGDTGRQIHAYGIGLYNNRGREVIRNVYTHHHGIDGLIIDGWDGDRTARSRIEGVRSEYNARQGCTVVGGRHYDFVKCRFAHTGKAGLVSAPGAGIDIEAEEKKVRDLTFQDCEFIDNAGPGMLADSGDSDGAVFRNCTFVGTTTWSAWPRKPNFRFYDSAFVGAIIHAFPDQQNPQRAAKFYGCVFKDDPALSPTRSVHRGHADTIAELSLNHGVVFSRCAFQLTSSTTLPWTNAVTYEECSMVQHSSTTAYPRGHYLGRNTIVGPVVLSGSNIQGQLTVNGRRVPRGTVS